MVAYSVKAFDDGTYIFAEDGSIVRSIKIDEDRISIKRVISIFEDNTVLPSHIASVY